jgi:hypothetical protein
MLGDLAAHRPHHQQGETAHAAPAQHDHVGVLARLDELVDRQAVHRGDRDRDRLGAEAGYYLIGFRLGRLLGLLGQGGVLGVVGHAAVHVAHGLVDHEHGERRAVRRCFGRGPFQGLAGMTGAVDSDNDASHVYLL